MLVPVSKSSLSDTDKIGVSFIRGWLAVDTEAFAYLRQTYGRGKRGLPKFILAVAVNPPSEFGEMLRAYGVVSVKTSVIRVWSLEEALEIANKRLPGLLKHARATAEVA